MAAYWTLLGSPKPLMPRPDLRISVTETQAPVEAETGEYSWEMVEEGQASADKDAITKIKLWE